MIQAYNKFVNAFDKQLSTKSNMKYDKDYHGKAFNRDFTQLTKLQKMDRWVVASTISGIARIVMAAIACVLNLARGEGKRALQNVKQIGRGLVVSIPFLNILWTQKFDNKEIQRDPVHGFDLSLFDLNKHLDEDNIFVDEKTISL